MVTEHTPGPWRTRRREGDTYHTHQIDVTERHIASIVGWRQPGNNRTTTEANARLIQHAPDLADALRDLLAWATMMGGWDGPCWRRAEAVLDQAARDGPAPAGAFGNRPELL